jgi:hypothetical protein
MVPKDEKMYNITPANPTTTSAARKDPETKPIMIAIKISPTPDTDSITG